MLLIFLCVAVESHAATATLSWSQYPESPNFKEFRVYRGSGAICGSGSVFLQPLMTRVAPFVQVVIPKGVPPAITPNTYVDANAPDAIGMNCYELTAVESIPSTVVGGVPTVLESVRSNRAIKFVVSPVVAPTLLEILP
ncbi:MAG: hypothetical protein D4R44_04050 [Actinobacteria bacterium]|nr:MAG: hypothetical protein D4R44_04050 [Actinomycetota bacterium]